MLDARPSELELVVSSPGTFGPHSKNRSLRGAAHADAGERSLSPEVAVEDDLHEKPDGPLKAAPSRMPDLCVDADHLARAPRSRRCPVRFERDCSLERIRGREYAEGGR